jgi:hypothetical protein
MAQALVPAVPLGPVPVSLAPVGCVCVNIVVCCPVNAAANGVVPAQRTHTINAGALAAGPLLHVGRCTGEACCCLLGSHLGGLHAADVNTVGPVAVIAPGVPAGGQQEVGLSNYVLYIRCVF